MPEGLPEGVERLHLRADEDGEPILEPGPDGDYIALSDLPAIIDQAKREAIEEREGLAEAMADEFECERNQERERAEKAERELDQAKREERERVREAIYQELTRRGSAMSQKRFPIIGEAGVTVPWGVVEPLRGVAKQVHSQTLERLAERGGLSRLELACLLVGLHAFSDGFHQVLRGCDTDLPVAALIEPGPQPQQRRDKATSDVSDREPQERCGGSGEGRDG